MELTLEERLRQQGSSVGVPDPAKVGVWRVRLTADEVAQFDAVAGDLLRELGYTG